MTPSAAVACGNPDTARAAAAVLRLGGNAVDAALAGGFMAALAEPGLTSLGGGGFLLVRLPDGNQHLLDFFVNAPGRSLDSAELTPNFTPINIVFSGADQVFHAGYGSVAVPGVLDGYLAAHRRFGRVPLIQVLSPARAAASAGVRLAPAQAAVLDLLRDILMLTPKAQQVYAPHGQLPSSGGVLRNHQYGNFLDSLGNAQVSGWSEVPDISQLVADMVDHHGLLTVADLQAYQVLDRAPLTGTYRGSTLCTNPAPSFGGSIVLAALEQLSSLPDAGAAHRVLALQRATTAAKLARTPHTTKGTTHISVVDGEGMIASMTTSNGSCSGVMAGSSGVQLNNMMGESDLHPDGFHAIEPGVRIGSMMAPMVLDLPDGTVVSLGSGGSERIRSALTQVVSALADEQLGRGDGVGLEQAIRAPRVHLEAGVLQVEPGLADEELVSLAAIGPVNEWSGPDLYFGGVHAVSWHPDGTVTAAGDPRRDGVGLVVPL